MRPLELVARKLASILLVACAIVTAGVGPLQDDPDAKPEAKAKAPKAKAKAPRGPVVDPDRVEAIDAEGIVDQKVPGKETHYLVWRAGTTWHLRAHAAGEARTFEGTIIPAGGPFRDVKGLGSLEASVYGKKGQLKNKASADELRASRDRIEFRFGTRRGAVDGLDIEVSPETTHLQFKLLIDEAAYRDRIFIGGDGAHPTRDLFILKAAP